ncbi:MAG: sensor histidine kinase [Ignavibacteria bacterium]|nr:sensor histidine kinase [Ignavibacteria bacterium]
MKLITTGKYPVIFAGILLVALIGTLDFITGSEISFSIFYLIPLFYVTWFTGRKWGFVFSVICAITWLGMDSLEARNFSVNAVHYWNALVRFGFFSVIVYLVSELKNHKENLEGNIRKRTADLQNEIIEHEKAKNEIIKKNNQLRELTKKIETIKEEENLRIAREIHDELGQSLTALNLEVMWINKKYSGNKDLYDRTLMISQIINETIRSVRKISSSLRPRLLDQLGLLPAIESLAKEFQTKTKIDCLTELPAEKIEISQNTSATMFRICQEALTNAARHSLAKCVSISITREQNNTVLMSVKDDGKGMDEDKINGELKGLGILGMKERAFNLGGKLEVLSNPDLGTEIVLEIPLENKK